MQVVLVMFRPDGQRRSFSVARDITVIGRREDCDLRIPLGDVSRKHCRLIKDGDAVRVEDLGSSNGTYRNGQRVQQSELEAGDTLQVGPVVFVLQVDGVPADEDLHPVTGAATAGAGEAGQEEELAVIEDGEAAPGEFDPMEALNAAEGSGFEFHLEEDAAAAAAAAQEEDGPDVQVDLSESAPPSDEAEPTEEARTEETPTEEGEEAELEESAEQVEEAGAETREAAPDPEQAFVEASDAGDGPAEAPAEPEEAAIELDDIQIDGDEPADELGDVQIDLEESGQDRNS